MSQENVEAVTRYFAAATRRVATYWEDPRPIADALEAGELDLDSREVLDHMHPDMRWKNALGIVFEGKAECARGIDELLEASQSYSVTVDEVTDLSADHVLAVLGVGMKGKSSGAAGTGSVFTLLTLREELIVESDEYLSRVDALRAAGLAEESTGPDLIELVRATAEAANRRDVDALMAFYAPDALLDGTRTILDLWRGRAEIRGVVEDWRDAYEEMEWAIEDPVDLGNGVAFAVVAQKASPVGVAGHVQQREGWVWVWVDDLIASVTTYLEADIDEARAAAERLAEERG